MFHCHFTLEDISIEAIKEAAKLIKGKVTPIDLWIGERHQIDRMITKYSRNCEFGNEASQLQKHYSLKRFKIEEMITDIEFGEKGHSLYNECHIKVNRDVGDIPGYAKSRNINEDGTLFYNRRGYDLPNLEMLKPFIIKLQYERVLFDSNLAEDIWWARPEGL